MPPPKKGTKGKGKGKKKKKKKDTGPPEYVSRYAGFDDEVKMLTKYKDSCEYVKLHLALVNWKFSNFTVVVKTDTSMADIGRLIETKHGRLSSLQLFMNPPHENNMIQDMRTRIVDLDVTGGPLDAPTELTLFYDFRTPETSPILLREPAMLEKTNAL